jgi:DnaK suppressor protein
MRKNDMETYRQQLLKLERRFKGEADTLADEAFHKTDGTATDNLSNIPVEDRAERAGNNGEEMAIGLLENASARLEEINAALGRIDDGTFGSCVECGQEVSSSRLRSVPFVRRCIECARKAQQGEHAAPGNL